MPTIPMAWSIFVVALVTFTGVLTWMKRGPVRTIAGFVSIISALIKGLILAIYYIVPRISTQQTLFDSWWMSLIGISLFVGMVLLLAVDFMQGGK